jgi:hypothetical protein
MRTCWLLALLACHPASGPVSADAFVARGALFSRAPHELVLLFADVDDPCGRSKRHEAPPPHTSLLFFLSDQRGPKLAEPAGPQEIPILSINDYIHARNEMVRPRDERRVTPPGVYAGVLVHLAGAAKNGPSSRSGYVRFTHLVPGDRAAGHYELDLEDGAHVGADFDVGWCDPRSGF